MALFRQGDQEPVINLWLRLRVSRKSSHDLYLSSPRPSGPDIGWSGRVTFPGAAPLFYCSAGGVSRDFPSSQALRLELILISRRDNDRAVQGCKAWQVFIRDAAGGGSADTHR